jgi:hypothetical protein
MALPWGRKIETSVKCDFQPDQCERPDSQNQNLSDIQSANALIFLALAESKNYAYLSADQTESRDEIQGRTQKS